MFGIPVEQLLLDPELVAEQVVIDKLNEIIALEAVFVDAEQKLISTAMEIFDLVDGSKRATTALTNNMKAITDPHSYFALQRLLSAVENTKRKDES